MTELYPDHPNLRGNYAPLRMECDIEDLIIEGEVPKELFGSYYSCLLYTSPSPRD